VITDEPLRRIGYALWEESRRAGAESILTEIIPRRTHAEEPPGPVAELMKHVEVILCPTSRSLTHTRARKEACDAGARVATLPGITEAIMRRTLAADYRRIKLRSERLAEVLTRGKRVEIQTEAGTAVSFSIEGREGHADHGLVHRPGEVSNLPAGEAYIAPVEGTANGVIFVDGSIGKGGLLRKPIKLTVKNGHAVRIEGGAEARALERLVAPFGLPARNIAELGIGTNDRALVTGNTLEDEKALRTIHIALGDNKTFGGTVEVPSHLDGIIRDPTLWIDGTPILRKGRILLPR
jgi:leucyl aminopeptidase (aminopeptidase T)